jgi:hypothetical protein
MEQEEPIATAREVLAREYCFAWPAPLVGWLRKRSVGLALDWVFRIAPELLTRTGSPHAAGLLAELEQLRQWRTFPPPSEVFRQKAEDLWYRPVRDGATTAMSHLCMAVAKAVCPDLELGVNWLWHVPSLLCDQSLGGGSRPQPELVEWCLADFEAFTAGFVEVGGEEVAPDVTGAVNGQ